MKRSFDLFMAGVGGQGIGLLAEVLARAADHAGFVVKGCDTHGLAQRGGIVTSHLRIGSGASSPVVSQGEADLVVALERHEALRSLRTMLAPGGLLLWYDASWQPLEVRLRQARAVAVEEIFAEAKGRGVEAIRVFREDLEDSRAQNVALIAEIANRSLIPGVEMAHYRAALSDLLDGESLAMNLAILEQVGQAGRGGGRGNRPEGRPPT
jgi:indolepyruvate ferredoxin oxidoreductase beta subunit